MFNNKKYVAFAYACLLTTTAHSQTIELNKINVNSDPQTISVSSFTNPVIIAGVPTYADEDPGTVSINKIDNTSFEIKFKEWPYLDGGHSYEDIPYLVLETGRYTMPDGSIWEVGTINQNQGSLDVYFSEPFTSKPAIFLSNQTQNNSFAYATRASSVTRHSFRTTIFGEETSDTYLPEIIGYVAIYQPERAGYIADHLVGNISYRLKSEIINSSGLDTTFGHIIMTEETSYDSETNHMPEVLNLLEVESFVFAHDITHYDRDPMTLRYTSYYDNFPIGNTNIALIGTNNLTASNYSASLTYSYDSPEAAFDGYVFGGTKVNEYADTMLNRGTWISYIDYQPWLQVDFEKLAIVTGFSIIMSSTYQARSPKDVIIQTSTDGFYFTNHETLSLTKGGGQFELTTPLITKHIRLKAVTGHSTNLVQIDELEYFGSYTEYTGPTVPEVESGTSCKALLDNNSSIPSGIYTLDPDAAGPIEEFEAYCDMESDGGGWTRVAIFNNRNELGLYTPTPEQTTSALSNGWHVSFGTVTGTEIKIGDIRQTLPVANQTLAYNLESSPVNTVIGNGQLYKDTIYINTEVRSTCDGTDSLEDPGPTSLHKNDFVKLGIMKHDSTLTGSLCYDYFAYGDTWGRADSLLNFTNGVDNMTIGEYNNWQSVIWIR